MMDGYKALARAVIADAVRQAFRLRCMWSARWLLRPECSDPWFWLADRRRSDMDAQAVQELNTIAQWEITEQAK